MKMRPSRNRNRSLQLKTINTHQTNTPTHSFSQSVALSVSLTTLPWHIKCTHVTSGHIFISTEITVYTQWFHTAVGVCAASMCGERVCTKKYEKKRRHWGRPWGERRVAGSKARGFHHTQSIKHLQKVQSLREKRAGFFICFPEWEGESELERRKENHRVESSRTYQWIYTFPQEVSGFSSKPLK